MCFRPGGVTKAMNCPFCGKKLMPVAGQPPKKCMFCKEDLTNVPKEKLEAANN